MFNIVGLFEIFVFGKVCFVTLVENSIIFP